MTRTPMADKLELLNMAKRVRELGLKLPLTLDSSDMDFGFAEHFVVAAESLEHAAASIELPQFRQHFDH